MAETQGFCESLSIYTAGVEAELIHPTLIWDKETAILVDTGYDGQLELFRQATKALGVAFERVAHIVLTHRDGDHILGLPAMVAALPAVEVLASEAEKPFVEAQKCPGPGRPAVRVTHTLVDGEELPYCGGVVVIATPGHQPGHICLYHRPTRTLVPGDALEIREDQLVGPNPHYTHDMATAIRSLANITRYDVQRVLCYHGGPYTGNVAARIAEIIRETPS